MTTWTELMISGLKILWETDKPSREIGAEMGVSKNAILGQAHRLGLPSRKWIKTGLKKGTRLNRKPVTRGPQHESAAAAVERKGGIHLSRLVPSPLPEYIPTVEGVPFLELRYGQCRAIIGHDDDERHFSRSCGQPVVEGRSYCPHHHRIYTYRQPARVR